MKSLKYSATKSLIYIVIFAGLLKVSGMLLAWLWNDYLVVNYGYEEITFLEAAGMLAFFYLIYAGVKFGFDNLSNLNFFQSKNQTPNQHTQCEQCDRAESSFILRSKFMSIEEKEKLKEAIAKCCGINNNQHISTIPHQKIQIKPLEKEKISN